MGNTENSRPPTMNDVAERAGVSRTTVSFVINNRRDINIPEETRERVWDAVEALGYRPNAMAKMLRTNRSQTIGFLTDEIVTTPHAVEIVQGAQDAAWNHGKILLLVNTESNEEVEQAAIDMMLERQVEGLIYATMYHRVVETPAIAGNVPTVLLDCFAEDRSLPSVVPDEVASARTATEILLEKGHRRVGFINNVDPIPATIGRLAGYKQALSAYGIPFEEELVTSGDSVSSAGGYDGALKLMQLDSPPTALFCFNDRIAMGAYDALRKLNLSIPDDVAVMGFDNQELIAANLHPALSTMALPHYEMGKWAVNYLIEHLDRQASLTPVQEKLRCIFIDRESI